METKSFRLNARNLALTYAQCELPVKTVWELLEPKLKGSVEKYIVVREKHLEGGHHIHVFVKLERPANILSETYFDLGAPPAEAGKPDRCFHGNYQSAREPARGIRYILKHIRGIDDPNILFSHNMKDSISKTGHFQPVPTKMLDMAAAGRVEEAMSLYKQAFPLQYARDWEKMEKSLHRLWGRKQGFDVKYRLDQFVIPDDLKALLDNYDREKTLVLSGPTGSGKSQFIKTFVREVLHADYFVVNNIDSIRGFNPARHRVIIFDDCVWDRLSRENIIKLVDSEEATTHDVKHGSVCIPAKTSRFILQNGTLFLEYNKDFPHFTDPAVLRRIVGYTIRGTLIRPSEDAPSPRPPHLPSLPPSRASCASCAS